MPWDGLPHGHHPIEPVDDTPLAEIDRPSCGSRFGLVGDEALAHQTRGGTLRRRTVFGHFELLEQLGAGAFGTVWKARDTQLDRIVALKIPRRGQWPPEEAEKFVREARAAAQLRPPHIVNVHQVGLEEGTIYIASDLIDGMSLEDQLTARRYATRETAHLYHDLTLTMLDGEAWLLRPPRR
jgi:serine/threonine protein kinase